MKTVTTTEDKVLEASKTSKEAKAALEILFPEIFENDLPYIKVGTCFLRKEYRKNIYTIMVRKETDGHRVRIYNITDGSEWGNSIKLENLKTYEDGRTLTKGEFLELVGTKSLDNISFIHNPDLVNVSKNKPLI